MPEPYGQTKRSVLERVLRSERRWFEVSELMRESHLSSSAVSGYCREWIANGKVSRGRSETGRGFRYRWIRVTP